MKGTSMSQETEELSRKTGSRIARYFQKRAPPHDADYRNSAFSLQNS
jgi:hypothetical protein